MSKFILHQNAKILCAHGGQVQVTSSNPKVTVSGQSIFMKSTPDNIAGCPFNVSGSSSPCVTASWTTASTRVTSNGMPVLLLDSQAICAPNGTPVTISTTQTKVTAT